MVTGSTPILEARIGIGRGVGAWLAPARQWPWLPLAILVPFVLVALLGDLIAPYEPTQALRGLKIFTPPAWMDGGNVRALLGTDFQGRDGLTRLIYGARGSLPAGALGTVGAGG